MHPAGTVLIADLSPVPNEQYHFPIGLWDIVLAVFMVEILRASQALKSTIIGFLVEW